MWPWRSSFIQSILTLDNWLLTVAAIFFHVRFWLGPSPLKKTYLGICILSPHFHVTRRWQWTEPAHELGLSFWWAELLGSRLMLKGPSRANEHYIFNIFYFFVYNVLRAHSLMNSWDTMNLISRAELSRVLVQLNSSNKHPTQLMLRLISGRDWVIHGLSRVKLSQID